MIKCDHGIIHFHVNQVIKNKITYKLRIYLKEINLIIKLKNLVINYKFKRNVGVNL